MVGRVPSTVPLLLAPTTKMRPDVVLPLLAQVCEADSVYVAVAQIRISSPAAAFVAAVAKLQGVENDVALA